MNTTKFCISLLATSLLVSVMHANFSPNREGRRDERFLAFNVRMNCASNQTILKPDNDMDAHTNPDEENVPGYAGSFTKLFNHDSLTSAPSEAGQASFEQLVKAMQSDLQANFNAIQFSPCTQRLLINPQAGLSYSMEGGDSSLFTMPVPPSITDAYGAADMIETYLQAICRDVKFEEYGTGSDSDFTDIGTGSITNNAALILNALGDAYTGPRNDFNQVDAHVLFRGRSEGDLIGPYLSQFQLQKLPILFPAGCAGFVAVLIGVQNLPQEILLNNQQLPIPAKREFGVSWEDFISIENGLIPQQYAYTDYNATERRYPIVGRDMGGYVHVDGPYEPYYNALFILAGRGYPISPVFPYRNGDITKESAGFNMGPPDAFCLVGGVALEAFKNAWAQKWRCWRRLRPEAMAGLVHHAKTTDTNPYGLDASLFATYDGIDLLQWVLETNQLQATPEYDPEQLLTLTQASTYLLGQMYPEGSPTHPAYPSGHATVAGACVTVIKAIFDDQALISSKLTPVKVDPSDPTQLIPLSGEGEDIMTVGSELDKLASNIAWARNFGGVHFRWDAEEGIRLGEQVAIRYLQDHMCTYPESGFTCYELTKRDGVRIRITPDKVEVI